MARARRGRGEGSVYFDKTLGLWVGRIDLGVVDGKRRQRKVSAKTKPEALAKMQRLIADPLGPRVPVAERPPAAQMTTGQWLSVWLDDILPTTVAVSTELSYRQVVKDWVLPYVGRVPLVELAPEHVDAMVRAHARGGRSANTQRLARSILRRALGIAERYGHVSRNVAALTDPPKSDGAKVDPLSAAEAVAVLEAARGDRLEALAVVVLNLGLRQSEALDLTWDDVDLERAELRVAGTKTAASRRVVPMPATVVEAMRRHRARQREERVAARIWVDPDLVFPTSVGTRYDKRGITRWWHGLTIRAGVGRRRFHASRHTAATLMLNAGVPLETVSKVLGHASYAITADVYAKPGADMLRQAADAMDRVLGGR
jgi:integrase